MTDVKTSVISDYFLNFGMAKYLGRKGCLEIYKYYFFSYATSGVFSSFHQYILIYTSYNFVYEFKGLIVSILSLRYRMKALNYCIVSKIIFAWISMIYIILYKAPMSIIYTNNLKLSKYLVLY